MGNRIIRSKASQPFTPLRIENAHGNVTLPLESPPSGGDLNRKRCKDKYVRVKSSNVSQNEMDMRLKHLRSMKYVIRSKRIITYSQINPDASNEEDASYQSPPQAKLASDLVVRCVPHLAQTLLVANSSGHLPPPSELGDDANSSGSKATFRVSSEEAFCPLPENAIEEQSCPICLHKIPLNFDSSGKGAESLCTTNSEGDRRSPEEFDTYVTTQCNHTFCKSCIQKVFDHAKHKDTCTIACPMCRAEINRDILYIKITSRTFVDNPNLSFIKDKHNRKMILEAYNTIHKNELWGKLRNLTPNEYEGFMFSKNPEIIEIMDLVNKKSTVGHSGLSMAITMRTIQQIARFGVDSLNTY
jgi:hypothetical protein